MLNTEKLNDINELAKSQENVFLPYPTADKIIAEVMQSGLASRETVMRMLLEYLTESMKSMQSGSEKLKSVMTVNKE